MSRNQNLDQSHNITNVINNFKIYVAEKNNKSK